MTYGSATLLTMCDETLLAGGEDAVKKKGGMDRFGEYRVPNIGFIA
jgi:hypothetical protein